MQYPVEFMTGVMVTSAVFITIAGIVIGLAKTDLGKKYSSLLLLSLLLGAAAVSFSLAWFNSASCSNKLGAIILLFLQWLTLWFPFIRLLGLFGRKGRAKKR
jgi:hypothetical protein